jgi:O-antigen ligase
MSPPPRQRSFAIFGLGVLVPLLGGGNVLVSLEPELAIRYLALTTVALAGLFITTEPERAVEAPVAPTIALVLLVSWWAATVALRPSGPRAALEAQGLFCAALLYALFSWKPLLDTEICAWVAGLVTGTLVTAAYGQYQYWLMFPRVAPLIRAMGGTPRLYVNANFYNSNCYAVFVGAVILLAVGAAPRAVRSSGRVGAALAISMLLVTLVLSQSRSTLALLVLAGAGLALGIGLPLALRWVLAAAVTAVVATAFVIANKVGFEELWRVGWLGRIAIWVGSLRMIREHWLFGVGLGRFWDYFEQYRINIYYTRYPHSFLLEAFSELGIFGGGALVFWLVASVAGTVRSWLRVIRLPPGHVDRRQGAAVVVAVGLLAVHGLFDIDWHAPANPVLLFALLAIGQHLASKPFASGAQPRKPGPP